MKHLAASEIALASRGDLPILGQLQAQAHLLLCPACRNRVEAFRTDRDRVNKAVAQFELPRAMNWNEIEGEMFANIRLGLDVSEIGREFRQPEPENRTISWRGAVAIAALSIIVMTGWFLGNGGSRRHLPGAVAQVRSGAMVLRGDENGIGVENHGVGLILRNASSPSARFEVSLDGSVRSSAVDEDSGQVTVSQVYVE